AVLIEGANKKSMAVNVLNFFKAESNIVFCAEPNERSGDPNYTARVKEENKEKLNLWLWGTVAAAGVLVVIYQMLVLQNMFGLAWLVPLKLVGLAVCFLLLSFDIAKDNRIVRNLCSLIRPGGCELVMTSRASRIFNLTWSEIGFFYFSATTLFLFAPLPLEVKRVFLGVISFGTLPFSIFSLYYQGRILKTWCALCVLIQILLLL